MSIESLQSQLKAYLVKAIAWPQEIHIESSSRCNSRCLTCPRDGMTRPQQEMPFKTFMRVAHELCHMPVSLQYIHLHLNGEAMLLPIDELVWRIDYLRAIAPNTETICMFTNGSLLTDEAVEKLLASQLDLIQVSIDGGNREDYEKIRRGLSWDVLLRNMRQLVKRRNETKSKLRIYTAIVPQKANENSVKEYFRIFTEDIKVNDAGGSGVNNLGGLIDSEPLKLPTQTNRWEWNDLPCWKLFLDLSIMADGRACACAQDVTGSVILGDIKQQTIKDIWHGHMLKHIREQFIMGDRAQLPLCGKCDNMRGCVAPEFWRIPREQWQQAYLEALQAIC